MNTLTNKNAARWFPVIAVVAATIPLVGCGGGGASAGVAPLPPVTDTTKNTVPPPTVPTPAQTVPSMNPADTAVSLATEAQVNAFRAENGLPALKHSAALEAIAAAYSKRMATEGFFSHNDPQGRSVFNRAAVAGYRYEVLGENLAKIKVTPGNEAEFTVEHWKASPTHRENMAFADFTDMAIGSFKAADGNYYLTLLLSKPG